MNSRIAVIAFGVMVVLALGVLDCALGRDLGLSLFYAIPVFLVARRAGLVPGLGLAALAAVAWAVADVQAGATYSRKWIGYWSAVTRFGYFVMAVAVARMRSGLELEAARARRDALTGLLNRRGFLETARLEVERAWRYRRPLSVAYLDCDDFKDVNDTYGHVAGDRLLREAAAVMRARLRTLDVAARVGGDEFVILLPETEAKDASDALGRLAEALRAQLNAQGWRTTFSIGVVTYARPPLSVETIVEAADRLMYRAKQQGKARLEQEIIDTSAEGADADAEVR